MSAALLESLNTPPTNTLSHSPNVWSPSEVCPKFSCQIWGQPAGANNIKQQLVPSLALKVMQKALKDDE